jgi:hypothetical protein
MRPLARALVAGAAVFAAVLVVLQVGLARPTAAERIAARAVSILDHTRERGSVIEIGTRRVTSTCTVTRTGAARIQLDDGTVIVAKGTRVLETYRLGERRTLALHAAADLPAAELVLSGSHALYARELVDRLAQRAVSPRPVEYRGRPAYALRLRSRPPAVELILDRRTLRPLAAEYRSADLRATSRLIAARRREHGC